MPTALLLAHPDLKTQWQLWVCMIETLEYGNLCMFHILQRKYQEPMVPDSLNFWEFCCLTPTDLFDTYPDLIKIPISIMEEIQLEEKRNNRNNKGKNNYKDYN